MNFELGKRYIVKQGKPFNGRLYEVKVLELSPNRRYVKVDFLGDLARWEDSKNWKIVEELKPAPQGQ